MLGGVDIRCEQGKEKQCKGKQGKILDKKWGAILHVFCNFDGGLILIWPSKKLVSDGATNKSTNDPGQKWLILQLDLEHLCIFNGAGIEGRARREAKNGVGNDGG